MAATTTIANLKDDLKGLAHSTSLDKITNLNSLLQRAARNFLTRIDPSGTKRSAQITNALHKDIYDYTAPSDLKGKKVIDIRPQVNRTSSDNMSQRFSKTFDIKKALSTFQIRDDSMVKTMRIAANLASSLTLHTCDSITANGTWAVGGDATNLTLDDLNYYSGSASLNFDLTGSATTGYLENSTMNKVDLSDEQDIGTVFALVYIPDTSIITNFILRWGDTSSAYWSKTVTAPWDRTSFRNGWNILGFDWNGATKTGSPDSSAIDYLRFTVTVSAATAETDLRLDKISCSAGKIWEIEYYSKYLFQSSGGTWKETTTDDGDYVNLDTDELNLFEYEVGMVMAQQIQGRDGASDYQFFKQQLGLDDEGNIIGGLYLQYLQDHPSEAIRPREFYYDPNVY